mmetsp:Transcript_75905/g.214656  ORF Transcript_75905/g.214656 Transcript_75905/m.214656 type:complete len:218 (+) Transcript_75905:318-971(+)
MSPLSALRAASPRIWSHLNILAITFSAAVFCRVPDVRPRSASALTEVRTRATCAIMSRIWLSTSSTPHSDWHESPPASLTHPLTPACVDVLESSPDCLRARPSSPPEETNWPGSSSLSTASRRSLHFHRRRRQVCQESVGVQRVVGTRKSPAYCQPSSSQAPGGWRSTNHSPGFMAAGMMTGGTGDPAASSAGPFVQGCRLRSGPTHCHRRPCSCTK